MPPDLRLAYDRAFLGEVQLRCMRRRHRRIGRASNSSWVSLILILSLLLLLELRVVESMGMGMRISIDAGMGTRRIFPSLVRKLRHGPQCQGEVVGRSMDTARGPVAEASSATNRGWTVLSSDRTQSFPESRVAEGQISNAALQMPETDCSVKCLDDPESGLWSRPGGQSHRRAA